MENVKFALNLIKDYLNNTSIEHLSDSDIHSVLRHVANNFKIVRELYEEHVGEKDDAEINSW